MKNNILPERRSLANPRRSVWWLAFAVVAVLAVGLAEGCMTSAYAQETQKPAQELGEEIDGYISRTEGSVEIVTDAEGKTTRRETVDKLDSRMTKSAMKHAERMAKIQAGVDKAQYKYSQPRIIGSGPFDCLVHGAGCGPVYGGWNPGVNTTYEGHTVPYAATSAPPHQQFFAPTPPPVNTGGATYRAYGR